MPLLHVHAAFAQTSGSIALVSDDRWRGISLSDERPAAQAGIVHDFAAGGYAGAFASTVRNAYYRDDLQADVYAGYARRLNSRASWDIGIVHSQFMRASARSYQELYAGLALELVSGRISFSPDYPGQGARAVYAQVDGSYPLRDWLRLVMHIGALRDPAHADQGEQRMLRDYRVGLRAAHADWSVQIERVGAPDGSAQSYDETYSRPPSPAAWVLSTSYAF